MADYRFHLQKYKPGSKISCPVCGKARCFTRYIDDEEEISFPDSVGICDHINSCGYHYSPKEYFHDHPEVLQTRTERAFMPNRRTLAARSIQDNSFLPSYIPKDDMMKSLAHYEVNPLFNYLKNVFNKDQTMAIMKLYCIGTSRKWGGAAVFWQVDIAGNVRTGKIMLYDSSTGHRVKEPHSYVGWVHSELKLQDFHLKQCLFGEHLLAMSPTMPVGIVESEKTAIICSSFVPDILWLATGGMNGCFNADTMSVLKDRNVTLFPDLGAFEIWSQKASLLSGICQRVVVSDLLEKNATDEQRSHGLDIADFLLEEPSKCQILQSMIQRNPVLQQLIDDLELELIE